MSDPSLDAAAHNVLGRYPPALREGELLALGNAGGFSGARLWRLQGPLGSLCLRAWPSDGPSPDRLRLIHGLMKRAHDSGLDFVPRLLAALSG